jgi:transposase
LVQLVGRTHDATQLRRAQGLLWLHDGRSTTAVADLLLVSRQTVYNWVESFRCRTDLDVADRLLDAPRRGRPATALGIIDPLIDAVIDGDPRDYGYRATTWTAPLLQRYLEEAHGIATSRKSVHPRKDRGILLWGVRALESRKKGIAKTISGFLTLE